MKSVLKISVAAGVLAALAAFSAPPAMARDHVGVGISFDDGVVAFGYRDGYWDHDHHWHRWHRHDDWREYREHHPDHYYARDHYHYRHHGWRDDH